MYDKDRFIWEVTNEAIALRENATRDELNKLSLAVLNPMTEYGCIYGQMTGSCFSEKASDLIVQCCPRYFRSYAVTQYNHFGNVINNANGTKVVNFKNARKKSSKEDRHFSAIEVYITLPNAKLKNLVSYLRKETDKLDLYF